MRNIQFINAGAGSGKTYTLTEKFADLIAAGETTPSRVILTTFTERAAEEFRLKARAMLISKGLHQRAAELDSALIGTVHSVALRYITKYWYLLGLGAGVQAMPEEDTERYISATLSGVASQDDIRAFGQYVEKTGMKQLMSSRLDYDFWKRDVKDIIEKAETFSVESLEESREKSMELFRALFSDADSGDEIREMQKDVMLRIFRIAGEWRAEYDRYKKEHDLVSFNDMERHFIRLLENPQVREDIADSVDYVFVDEFQDSNPTQVKIFDRLSEIARKGSFWVGDPKQAIYDFRGCDTELTSAVTGIIGGKAETGEAGFGYDVLPKSWRSDPALVDLVNKAFVPVFAPVLSRDKVELTPERKSELPAEVPNVMHWSLIGQAPEGATRLSYKKEFFLRMVAAGVCDMVGGRGDIQWVLDKETKKLRKVAPSDIAVLCRTNGDCDDLTGYLRELGLPVTREYSVDATSKEVALLLAVLNYILGGSSLLDAELAYLIEDANVPYIMEGKDRLRECPVFPRLDALRDRLRDKPVSYVVESAINELDLENLVYKWENGKSRLYVLEAVKAQAATYENECLQKSEAATLGGFIHFLSTNPVTVSRDIQAGGVNVLTYHASKGLEWNVVILCSLSKDELNEKDFIKSEYIGVTQSRKSAPTAENLYSDYIIRYIPPFLPAPNSRLPEGMAERALAQEDYADRETALRNQLARLLYVGATRARDYLITASAEAEKMKWLSNLGIQCEATKKSMDGNYHIWGTGAPMSSLKRKDIIATPMSEAVESYVVIHPKEEPVEHQPKFVVPSAESSADEAPGGDQFTEVYPEKGTSSERITVSGTVSAYDQFGTCIHNIFAVYRPGEYKENMEKVQRIIEGYGLEDVLRAPSDILRAADNLYAFLEKTYGKPIKIYKEQPFSFVREGSGQMVTGEMDLVWETEEGCVLVDYKNYPGYDDVLEPKSKFFVGKYLPQMGCYREALKGTGKNVNSILVFYAVQGRIVMVNSPHV